MYRWETSGLENTALWSERHELEQNKRKKISLQHGQSNSPTPKSTLAQKYVPEKIQSMLTDCFEIGPLSAKFFIKTRIKGLAAVLTV